MQPKHRLEVWRQFSKTKPPVRPQTFIKTRPSPLSGECASHDANHVYQNKTPVSGERTIHDASQIFFGLCDNFSVLHTNPTKQNGLLTGVVRLILPPHLFVQRNGVPGMVQSFIVVDSSAKRLNSDVWRYKIVAWNDQAKNLNIETNRVYHFEHFKMKPAKGNCNYPGQDNYEIHLTPISTIFEVTA